MRKGAWLIGGVLAVVGCGGTRLEAPAPPPVPVRPIPAGVDSVTAMEVDSIADASFVSEADEAQALALQDEGRLMVERTDSMWLVMSALIEAEAGVSESDSLEAREAANEGGVALVQLDSLIRVSDLDQQTLARESGVLLDSAEVALERSFQLNPFDTRSRVWLSQVYELQARRLGRAEQYQRAIEELEKLTLLTPISTASSRCLQTTISTRGTGTALRSIIGERRRSTLLRTTCWWMTCSRSIQRPCMPTRRLRETCMSSVSMPTERLRRTGGRSISRRRRTIVRM